MVKKKQEIQVPETIINKIEDAIYGKKEKEGGKRFVLNEPAGIPGQIVIHPGAIIIECNDGNYKIKVQEKEMHYRLTKFWLDKMSVTEVGNSD